MEFRVLGPIEAVDGGRPVDLGAPKERALLARLLVDVNTTVSTDRLLEDLWPEGAPGGGPRSLHVHVARLRATLAGAPDAVVETAASGYILRADPERIDSVRFDRMWRSARAKLRTNPRHAAATLRRALGLWRGPAFADFEYESFVEAEIRRLSELRMIASEDLNEAELALGNGAEIVGHLRKLVTEHPLRERLWGQLMVALYQADRQADALRAFRDAASTLAEELGIEPSRELRNVEERILLHDTGLLGSPSVPPEGGGLPPRLSSFVGRWREAAELRRIIAGHRLVTVTGAGGIGKTSLAVEAARDAFSDFADGTQLVPLDGLDPGDSVPDEIARVLGRRVGEGETPAQALCDYLEARQVLVILDNCERLIGDVAETAGKLLEGCPEIRILATSREPLEVEGETVYRLDPLGVPPAGTADIRQVRAAPAVQLFLDRAASSQPGFLLTEENRDRIDHICRSLDGIPLAVELAAARLAQMSCEDLASRMDDQIGLLTGGRRTALPRHRTLEAALDVSYGMLADFDRALLRHVGVFRGGFAVEDASAVFGHPDSQVLGGIARLVAASLIVVAERGTSTRYRMLEPVRQFAAERLREAGEEHAARLRHGSLFANKAAAIARMAESGEIDQALARGHRDREDFRGALRWTNEAGETGLLLELAAGLGPYWRTAGPKAEGFAWLEAALDSSPTVVSELRFDALDHAVQFGIACNESVGGRLAECDRLARDLGGRETRARALYLKAVHAWSRGRLADAIGLAEASCRLTEADGGPLSRARLLLSECLIRVGRFDEAEQVLIELISWDERHGRARDYGLFENLGMAFYARGDLEEAERLVEEAVKGFGSRGSRSSQMEAMSYLAWITIDLGKDRRTRLLAERALAMAREDSEVMVEANSLWVLARLALRDGDLAGSRSLLTECLRVARRRRERIVVALALFTCADLACIEGEARRAVGLLAAADRRLRALPHIVPASMAGDHRRSLAALRSELGDRAWEAAWAEGEALALDDAICLCTSGERPAIAG
jgi:predicted ATPase/DNA-binding SARP family transcriptional activator